MASAYLPADLKRPSALRWLAYYFLWVAHLFEPLPLAMPLSLVVYVVAHLDVLRLPRRWSMEMILAVIAGLYVMFLLVIHRTIFDVNTSELAQSVRIPYRMLIFLLFAITDPRLALEAPLIKTGLRVGGLLAAVSIYFFVTNPDAVFFEERKFVIGGALSGLFTNHNVLASAMGALVVGAFAWWLHKRSFRTPWEFSLLEFAALPMIATAFLLAKSRSFIGAALAVGLYAGFLRRGSSLMVRLGSVAITIAGIIAGSYIIATRDQQTADKNIEERWEFFEKAIERLPESPLIGVGVGAFSEVKTNYRFRIPWVVAIRMSGERVEKMRVGDIGHTHNMYLETALDVGLLGVLVLGFFFYAGVQRYWRIMRVAGSVNYSSMLIERACLNGDLYMTALVFLLVSGMFSGFTLFGIPSSLILYASLGRMVALSQNLEEESQFMEEYETAEDVSQPEKSVDSLA